MKTEQISGRFIPFTDSECELLDSALEVNGYEKTGDGLREFIIDTVLNDPEQETQPQRVTVSDQIGKWILDNPESAAQMRDTVGKFGKTAISTLLGKLNSTKKAGS